MSSDVRVRELTAAGRGAIRVLELRGPGCAERIRRLAPDLELAPGAFARAALRAEHGSFLDEAIVLAHSPQHFEVHLHGSPFVVTRVLQELGVSPETSAREIEARAEDLLASAASDAAARMLLDQAQGALRTELTALLALEGADYRAAALRLVGRGRVARRLLCPPRVVLAGPVNAGKSTLFNALVGSERAVVDAAEGTTRDAVFARVLLGAYAVDVFDTAGERDVPGGDEGAIEMEGQARATDLQRAADLVLWLEPSGAGSMRKSEGHTRVLRSRIDMDPRGLSRVEPGISALHAPAEARSLVEELLRSALRLPEDPWIPGAGVPFQLEWLQGLELDDVPASRCRVRECLGRSGPRIDRSRPFE